MLVDTDILRCDKKKRQKYVERDRYKQRDRDRERNEQPQIDR